MYNIFLETSEQIQIDDGDSSHLDFHQEDHDDQDVLQVQGWILMDFDDLDDLDERLDQGS